jgi:hypothetical protein
MSLPLAGGGASLDLPGQMTAMNGVNTSGTGPSTRRALLQGALAITVMAAAPPGTRAQQKAEKSLVQYQDKSKGEQQCDHCVQFLPPDSCRLVAGQISPQGWCALFTAKPK